MRRISVAALALMLMAGATFAALNDGAQKDGAKKMAVTNKMCPVMNAPASEKFRSEYKGQYVYFCCQGCVTMFNKDPEKYIAELSKEDLEAIQPNKVCPITEDPITDHTLFVEDQGRKVYVCCAGCVNMYKKKMAERKAE